MDIKKMIAIVQLYIGIRTGSEVEISIKNGTDLVLLSQAYKTASNWINENNVTVIQL